jgi:hypothetical protein
MPYIGNQPYQGVIDSGNIVDGSIQTGDLANSAVTTAKIADSNITTTKIADTGVTVAKLNSDVTQLITQGSVTKITSLTYSGDDLAVGTTSPLPITLTGTNFETGSTVYIDTITPANAATAISYTGTTQITCTPPIKSAASYNLWLVGPTGKLTVLANGILYSGTPNWSGQSTSLSADASNVSIQLTAAGDTPLVYSLVSGTLPTGVTLNSSGLISGAVTGLTNDTTYSNLVIRANDPQNQDASITINLTIIVQHKISRSLRFNYQADSTDLTRTFTQAGNRKTWTLSMWVKRTLLATTQTLFSYSVSGDSNGWLTLWITNDDKLRFQNWNGWYAISDMLFRDPSAWYHIVLAVDTTQSVTANRVKIYINGLLITYTNDITFSLNQDTFINSANVHYIGKSLFDLKGWNGYMTEIYFIDGQALTSNSFAQTDSVTGVWTPKSYTGTYGTNGFYLNFSDNSNTTATTLGKDYSGNGNNWTPNNFSVAAEAGNDSLVDSPTRYGTDTGLGGEVRGNYCTINPIDKHGSISLSNGSLDMYNGGQASWQTARATFGITTGKWYWETLAIGTDNSSRYSQLGIAQETHPLNTDLYTAANAPFMWDARDGVGYSAGALIGLAVDFDAGSYTFFKNGVSARTGSFTAGIKYFPAFNSYGSGSGWTVNFGQRPFAYTAPSGYKALCTTNLAIPTVVQGDDYFNTVLYTGSLGGSAGTQAVTGVGFQPDFTWIKNRNSAGQNNVLVDAVRGYGTSAMRTLYSNQTQVEQSNASNSAEGPYYGNVQSLNSDGFTVASSGNATPDATAKSGWTYVAWNWKANGAGVTNTAGSITSTVSANTTSGFSIVRYNGTSANATIGHGLGVAPKMIIRKYVNDTDSWYTYHASLGANKYLALNETSAATTSIAIWQNTAPTSTVFSIGSGNNNSNSVAYCFAEIPGFSAFGSYTGNGSTDGPFIYLGFRPRWIMLKSSSTGGAAGYDWIIQDTSRAPANLADTKLIANSSSAENTDSGGSSTSGFGYDILSNGFKLRSSGGGQNGSGATYIYAAFAETPFNYALAR